MKKYTQSDLIDALVVARNIDPENSGIFVQEAGNIVRGEQRLNQVVLKLAKEAFQSSGIETKNTATGEYINILTQYQKNPSKEYLN